MLDSCVIFEPALEPGALATRPAAFGVVLSYPLFRENPDILVILCSSTTSSTINQLAWPRDGRDNEYPNQGSSVMRRRVDLILMGAKQFSGVYNSSRVGQETLKIGRATLI